MGERITLQEYAKRHGKTDATVRQKVLRGGLKTAVKSGWVWLVDEDEPYEDERVTSGKYVGADRPDPNNPKRRGRPPKNNG